MEWKQIQEKYQVETLVAKMLADKNLNDDQLNQLMENDFLLHHSNCANIAKIKQVIDEIKARNGKILIAGDYDADGICATVIMKDALDKYGVQSGFYVPNRLKEGYGLSTTTVELAFSKGYECILTVDNGVAAEEALNKAKELGIKMIVTDHHVYKEGFEPEYFLHPNIMEERFKEMCGAAVAFTLSNALIGFEEKHLILACIATISDMVPLWNENRCLVVQGLKCLNKRTFTALELLLDRKIEKWDETVIAFQIAPKINAVGRLSDIANPNNVVRYLLLPEGKMMVDVAAQIKSINQKRKELSEKMGKIALDSLQDCNFNVCYDPSFHEGMVGILAGKLMQKTKRPSVVFAPNQEMLKGSIRSVPGLDLHEFFADFDDLLVHFGGHEMAAGIEIKVVDYDRFVSLVHEKSKDIEWVEEEKEYTVIEVKDASIQALKQLERFAPFGKGFELPLFMIRSCVHSKTLVKNSYPKWILDDEIEAISFDPQFALKAEEAEEHAFIGTLSINTFLQKSHVSMKVEEII